jgi:glycosyltransferase involved in cell wall biosynthesis
MKLKIAAKIEGDDDRYFRETIKPLLGPDVEFVGEVDEEAKVEFLSNAAALLFPIDWPEPFGLVVIEAMAFGVPVVAWREGAMPEIIDEGETGFVVDSVEAAVEAVARCAGLDREHIRGIFERRFSAERMISDYEAIYRTLTDEARNVDRKLIETLAGSDRF